MNNALAIANFGAFSPNNSTITNNGLLTIENTGYVCQWGGTLDNHGTLDVETCGELQNRGGTVNNGCLNGPLATLAVAGGYLSNWSGTLNNYSAAVLTISGGGSLYNGPFPNSGVAATLNNYGTVAVDSGATLKIAPARWKTMAG